MCGDFFAWFLNLFSEQLAKQSSLPKLPLENWSQAFSLLSSMIKEEETVILLDEISWMSVGDKDFAGKLKIAWDTEFKKHNKLVLVLCGSVSSWIDKNILNNTGFIGRTSLVLKLEELPLHHCNSFFGKNSIRISSEQKFKLLSITGGVPRYLEEIQPDLSAEENILRLCFMKTGILFSEFDSIFNDIFSNRAPIYKKIIQALIDGSKDITDISQIIGKEKSGVLSSYLDDLCESGFLAKDVPFQLRTFKNSKFCHYRLKDNYIRFYLKYIEKNKTRIKDGLTVNLPLSSIINWNSIKGLQFKNLVLNNVKSLCKLLNLGFDNIISAKPYFQRKTKKQNACQVDLLIVTSHALYVCEMKFREKINKSVIDEVKEKVDNITIPKQKTVRTVLIYDGQLSPTLKANDYFDRIINMSALLEKNKIMFQENYI